MKTRGCFGEMLLLMVTGFVVRKLLGCFGELGFGILGLGFRVWGFGVVGKCTELTALDLQKLPNKIVDYIFLRIFLIGRNSCWYVLRKLLQ